MTLSGMARLSPSARKSEVNITLSGNYQETQYAPTYDDGLCFNMAMGFDMLKGARALGAGSADCTACPFESSSPEASDDIHLCTCNKG